MKLSQIKEVLQTAEAVNFQLPGGTFVPEHFHVTEVGVVNKRFIDCGGTLRNDEKVVFQLWNANDTDHRLKPQKLLTIIALSEKAIGINDAEVEVEYQSDTVGIYGLDFRNGNFVLLAKQTDCLAKDNCGIPAQKERIKLADLSGSEAACCSADGGCC
jgi:hypothetical protein